MPEPRTFCARICRAAGGHLRQKDRRDGHALFLMQEGGKVIQELVRFEDDILVEIHLAAGDLLDGQVAFHQVAHGPGEALLVQISGKIHAHHAQKEL